MSQRTSSQPDLVTGEFELLDQNKAFLIKGEGYLNRSEIGTIYAQTNEGESIAARAKWLRWNTKGEMVEEVELRGVSFCNCEDSRFEFIVNAPQRCAHVGEWETRSRILV